jgi:hypothetical protein
MQTDKTMVPNDNCMLRQYRKCFKVALETNVLKGLQNTIFSSAVALRDSTDTSMAEGGGVLLESTSVPAICHFHLHPLPGLLFVVQRGSGPP